MKLYKKLLKILFAGTLAFQTVASVSALENVERNFNVETTAGNMETVVADITVDDSSTNAVHTYGAVDQYLTEDGMLVDFSMDETSTSHADGSSTVVGSQEYVSVNYANAYYAEGGYEYKSEKKAPVFSVSLPLVENGVSEKTGRTSVDPTGDVKNDVTDGTYDYTDVVITTPSKVKLSTKSVVVKQGEKTSSNQLDYIYGDVRANNGGTEIMNPTAALVLPNSAEEVPAIKEGYDHVYLGISSLSHYWAAVNYKTPVYTNETPVYKDDNGNAFYTRHSSHSNNFKDFRGRDLLLSGIYVNGEYIPAKEAEEGEAVNKNYFAAAYDTIQSFVLSDANGNLSTAYCVDQTTKTEKHFSYIMKNMEDETYYTDGNADMIRSVAWNGYWGASSGLGSLSYVKQKLLASTKFTQEEVDALSDGIAMTATQYAIWTFSNKMDDVTFLNAYYRTIAGGYPGKGNVTTASKTSSDLLMKYYNYLITLPPTTYSDMTTGNTIINEKNFLASVNVDLKEKDWTLAENNDVDTTNDTYLADVSFALKVIPRSTGENADDLIVVLKNENDEVIASGKVAGGSDEELLVPVNGMYTFDNVALSEGTQELRFYIVGKQYIDQGIYLYTAETRGNTESQRLIGIASGMYDVNVQLAVNFGFEVEDEESLTQRFYRLERNITPAKDTLEGTKYLEGEEAGGFEFELSNEDGVIQTVKSDENGKFVFAPITFDTVGTYTYTVKEKAGNDPTIVYDKTIYEVVYTVDREGSELVYTKEIKVNDEIYDAITFNNKEEPPVTGDASNKLGYLVALFASLGCLLLFKKKNKN